MHLSSLDNNLQEDASSSLMHKVYKYNWFTCKIHFSLLSAKSSARFSIKVCIDDLSPVYKDHA